jgi:hypothetical protein
MAAVSYCKIVVGFKMKLRTLLKDSNMLKPYSTSTMFEKVNIKYAVCITCVSLTDFPEPLSV